MSLLGYNRLTECQYRGMLGTGLAKIILQLIKLLSYSTPIPSNLTTSAYSDSTCCSILHTALARSFKVEDRVHADSIIINYWGVESFYNGLQVWSGIPAVTPRILSIHVTQLILVNNRLLAYSHAMAAYAYLWDPCPDVDNGSMVSFSISQVQSFASTF